MTTERMGRTAVGTTRRRARGVVYQQTLLVVAALAVGATDPKCPKDQNPGCTDPASPDSCITLCDTKGGCESCCNLGRGKGWTEPQYQRCGDGCFAKPDCTIDPDIESPVIEPVQLAEQGCIPLEPQP